MALLYRVARLRDRADTHVFTFVVTRSVTRDPERDVTSKELSCGHHKWAITFSRADSALGVYLVWRSACEGMRVYVDFTFTLLNRDHFSTNEGFSGKQVKFTTETPAQGSRRCILLSELAARGFADARGEFQLELCVGALRTVFAADVRLPHTPVVVHAAAGTHHHHHSRSREGSAGSRLESAYFSFGGFDWNLALVPQPKDATGEPSVGIQLNRLSGLTHAVRARFVCALGDAAAPRRADSGPVDALADADGRAPVAWSARGTLNEYAHKGSVRVVIELLSVRALCEVSVALGASGPPLAAGAPPPPAAQLYDRDKQAWAIRSDCHSETVRLHMVYKDIHNVPRNHLRYMSWSASVVRVRGPGANTAVTRVLPGAPYSHYYAQDSSDEGIIMETDLAVKEVRDPSCPFLSEATGGGAGGLRVQVEWGDSYLLFQATYHAYDDVCRVHNHQMKREIAALQAENYSLERQLFSYQKSMAYTHARGGYSDEPVTPDGGMPMSASATCLKASLAQANAAAAAAALKPNKQVRSEPESGRSIWAALAGLVCSLGSLLSRARKPP